MESLRPASPRTILHLVPVLLLLIAAPALCGASVNRSIHIHDGERVDDDLSSVNGSIEIGAGAVVSGTAETVNGGIEVERDARTGGLSTVNGSIEIAENVIVDGSVESVNGKVRVRPGAEIRGWLTGVNGELELEAATVLRGVETVSGDVELRDGARIQEDIRVERARGWSLFRHGLDIRIDATSSVEGDIVVEEGAREVTVYLRDRAQVTGEIVNAKVVTR